MQAPAWWWRTPPAAVARALLPAASVYGWVSRTRRRCSRARNQGVPVVCVGNLVVGGAGKTPATLAIAHRLAAAGLAVHFATRGYGGRLAGPVRVDPACHTFKDVGDEALLLARRAPAWVASKRAAGVQAAADGAHVVVMDDGFQNPSVRPDLAFVVIDAGQGFGNGLVFPAGPLREPAGEGLARASCVVIVGPAHPADAVADVVARSGVRVLKATLLTRIPPALAGQRMLAFAGIGRPDKFFAGLQAAGGMLCATRAFPDHHPFSEQELKGLITDAERLDANLVTTEKDAVRLPPWAKSGVAVAEADFAWVAPAELDSVLHPVLARAQARGDR